MTERPVNSRRPTVDLVSQPLIVQDEFANHIRELFALPTALKPAGALTLASRSRRTQSGARPHHEEGDGFTWANLSRRETGYTLHRFGRGSDRASAAERARQRWEQEQGG